MQNIILSDLIRKHPLATTFLNEHHIDYCCGGDHLLYSAIEEQGLDKESFLLELEQYLHEMEERINPVIREELYEMSIEELIDHLEDTHHQIERMLLSSIDEKLYTILSVHYTHHKDELVDVFSLFEDLRKELLIHFVQEEKEVFPLMKREATQATLMKVEALEADHEGAGILIKQLQKRTNDFTVPSDGCPTYRATYDLMKKLVEDIFLHIYTENAILFPKFEQGVML